VTIFVYRFFAAPVNIEPTGSLNPYDTDGICCRRDLRAWSKAAWTSGACGPARPCPDVTGSHPLPTVAGELIKQGSKWEWDAEAASRRSTAQPAPLTHCLIQPWLFKNSAGTWVPFFLLHITVSSAFLCKLNM
jgi:hypothetical protein